MQRCRFWFSDPRGSGARALEETLTRLGYVVMAAEARHDRSAAHQGDIVMLDLRGEDADWGGWPRA